MDSNQRFGRRWPRKNASGYRQQPPTNRQRLPANHQYPPANHQQPPANHQLRAPPTREQEGQSLPTGPRHGLPGKKTSRAVSTATPLVNALRISQNDTSAQNAAFSQTLSSGEVKDYLEKGVAALTASEDSRRDFVNDLATEGGLRVIKQIVESKFSASYSVLNLTFDPHCLLFLAIISFNPIMSSLVLESAVGTIYNFIYGPGGIRAIEFFSRVAACLVDTKAHQDENGISENEMPFVDAFGFSTKAFLATLSKNQSAAVKPEFKEITNQFSSMYDAQELQDISNDALRSAHENMLKVQAILSMSHNITASIPPKPNSEFQPVRPPVDLPGDRSRLGPRHDNDHENIAHIRTLPTISEILAERPDFLPERDAFDDSSHHETGILRLIDTQFRLLRQDTSGVLRNAIQFILTHWNQLVHTADWRRRRRLLREESPTPIRIFSNAEIKAFLQGQRSGLEAEVEFDQLHRLSKMPMVPRKRWWMDSLSLKENSAVLALIDGQEEEHVNVVFLVVSKRELNAHVTPNGQIKDVFSNARRAMVTLRLIPNSPHPSDVANLLEMVHSTRPLILVEFPAYLFRHFDGILRCLQVMRLNPNLVPLATWLIPRVRSAQRPEMSPMTRLYHNEIRLPPPSYLHSVAEMDLSCLPRRHPYDPSPPKLTFSRYCDLEKLITQLSQKTTLDTGQATALLAAIRHQISLIQGPPGTGKSYVGIQLAKVLLANKSSLRTGPILCVCYTNHALDQFLSELIQAGVTNIVKFGGRSSIPHVEACNINNFKKNTPKARIYGIGKRIVDTRASCAQIADRIGALCKQMDGNGGEMVVQYIRRRYPSHSITLFNSWRDKDPLGSLEEWINGNGPGDPNSKTERANEELLKVNVYTLTKAERVRLYNFWYNEAFKELSTSIQRAIAEFSAAKRQCGALFSRADLALLESVDVVGATTTGLANNADMLRNLETKVLIVEEAGEVLESHVLTALLPSVQHAILIGDHLQLRPKISDKRLSMEYDRDGPKYSLDESLFERLANSKFVAENATNDGNAEEARFPVFQLDHQRRMHPSVASLVRDTLYPQLRDHPDTVAYPEVMGFRKRLFWLDHRNVEDPGDPEEPMMSKSNIWEAKMVLSMVRHIFLQGKYNARDIAVLTPYVGQLRLLRTMLEGSVELVISEDDLEQVDEIRVDSTGEEVLQRTVKRSKLSDRLRLSTVDNFQGEEATIVIVSLVRSNRYRNCGFLKTFNRINVLLSRARHGMYIIGDANTASSAPMWESVVHLCEKQQNIGPKLELECSRHPEQKIFVSEPDDFVLHSPEGGCRQQCSWRLSCGHRCSMKCHPVALHNTVNCIAECLKPRLCGHKCQKQCGEPCGECMEMVYDVELPCGHRVAAVQCRHMQKLDKFACKEMVTIKIPECGHDVRVRCEQRNRPLKCTHLCDMPLECGHQCRKQCHQCRGNNGDDVFIRHGSCTTQCNRPYSNCSHLCPKMCHPNEPCPPCSKPCEVKCKHSRCPHKCQDPCPPCAQICGWGCEHREPCNLPCAVPCLITPCNLRCSKKLSCGHRCPGVCGEKCPTKRFCQECGDSKAMNQVVDMIMLSRYKDVIVDEDPVVFLSCGHFYTISCLDRLMELSKYYVIDEHTGQAVTPKRYDFVDSEVKKQCPECRMPVRNIERYNRIVKRSLIDEATRRFILRANAQCAQVTRFVEEQEISIEAERRSFTEALFRAQSNQLLFLFALNTYKKENSTLEKIVADFIAGVSKTEQPFGRVESLFTAAVDQLTCSAADQRSFILDEAVVLTGFSLRGQVLELRLAWAIYWNLKRVRLTPTLSQEAQEKLQLTIDGVAMHYVMKAFTLIESSAHSKLPRHEAEARIYYAMFLSLSPSDNLGLGTESLDIAQSLIEEYPGSCTGLALLLEKARGVVSGGTIFQFVSDEETRAVFMAMNEQFQGTGHWYYCANRHPFTIGECGLPMEEARCPACDAPVGGQNHVLAGGVQRAEDLEETFS